MNAASVDIAFVVLFFNHQSFVEERLRSVFNQNSFRPSEIYIVDDHSSDETLIEIQSYFHKHPPPADISVNIIANPKNFGQVATLRRTVTLIRTKYIWIAEGDDTCHPNFIEKWRQASTEKDLDLYVSDSSVIDQHGRTIQTNFSDWYLRQNILLDRDNDSVLQMKKLFQVINIFPNLSATVWRRDTFAKLINKPHMQKAGLYFDWLMYAGFFQRTEAIKFKFCPEPLNHFRYRPTSASGKLNQTQRKELILNIYEILDGLSHPSGEVVRLRNEYLKSILKK